jgi:hypothetical protein
MSRPLRIEFPGAWYHVMNHGRRRENISLDANDYQTFIKLLQETDERWNIQIAAYCLTPHKAVGSSLLLTFLLLLCYKFQLKF